MKRYSQKNKKTTPNTTTRRVSTRRMLRGGKGKGILSRFRFTKPKPEELLKKIVEKKIYEFISRNETNYYNINVFDDLITFLNYLIHIEIISKSKQQKIGEKKYYEFIRNSTKKKRNMTSLDMSSTTEPIPLLAINLLNASTNGSQTEEDIGDIENVVNLEEEEEEDQLPAKNEEGTPELFSKDNDIKLIQILKPCKCKMETVIDIIHNNYKNSIKNNTIETKNIDLIQTLLIPQNNKDDVSLQVFLVWFASFLKFIRNKLQDIIKTNIEESPIDYHFDDHIRDNKKQLFISLQQTLQNTNNYIILNVFFDKQLQPITLIFNDDGDIIVKYQDRETIKITSTQCHAQVLVLGSAGPSTTTNRTIQIDELVLTFQSQSEYNIFKRYHRLKKVTNDDEQLGWEGTLETLNANQITLLQKVNDDTFIKWNNKVMTKRILKTTLNIIKCNPQKIYDLIKSVLNDTKIQAELPHLLPEKPNISITKYFKLLKLALQINKKASGGEYNEKENGTNFTIAFYIILGLICIYKAIGNFAMAAVAGAITGGVATVPFVVWGLFFLTGGLLMFWIAIQYSRNK